MARAAAVDRMSFGFAGQQMLLASTAVAPAGDTLQEQIRSCHQNRMSSSRQAGERSSIYSRGYLQPKQRYEMLSALPHHLDIGSQIQENMQAKDLT